MATDSFVRWPELDAIFAAALDLEPPDRPGFLDRSCGDDDELRRELERLLAAAGACSDFLEDRDPLLERLADARRGADRSGSEVGRRIGSYRLIEEIGRGGMGMVYLAERADRQFEQRVALKLLGGWVRAPAELRRFQRERQILARLQHPHIARLLDGGVTEDGRPYFVMDYVDGIAIDRYCDERRLDVRHRLQMFLDVCAAVEFAHRNLVVHRDLKPGNVLVTAEGRPKLLDFGIAKLLHEDQGEPTDAVTRTGLRPMTPEYASPEMVSGEPVGTASDVYQLGVLLYQLLAGRSPYRLQRRTMAEIERMVRTTDAEKPSGVVTRPAAAESADPLLDQVARARNTTPDRLSRRLRGDLDNIVLTALRKEPERRYGSVEQLAEDVRRHLEGRPVRARPDTLRYRSAKFVQRHRFGVGTGALAAVLVVGFAIAMARQAQRTARERDKAEQVTQFIVDLFQHSDPDAEAATPGDTLTVRRVLEEGAQRMRTELLDQPAVRASLLAAIGGVYRSLGLYDEARPLLEEALALRRHILDPDDPELGNSLSELGLLLLDQRDPAAAEPLLHEALRITRATRGERDLTTATRLNDYAVALHTQGRLAEAEALYRAALAIQRTTPGPPNKEYPIALTNLGWILIGRDDYAAADSAFSEALDIRRRIHPPGHPRIANSLSSLAYLRNLEGRYAEAEALAREALQLRRALYGDAHQSVAEALLALANSVARQGRLGEAESLYRESLAVYQETIGAETPDAARALSELGLVLSSAGRTGEAETVAREALSIYRRRLGQEHPATLGASMNLAELLSARGRYAEAESLYRAGLRMVRNQQTGDDPRLTRLLMGLGWLELERGDPAAAEPHLREGSEMLQRLYPAGDRSVARARATLGECLLARGRPTEAEPILQDAYHYLVSRFGDEDPDTRRARSLLDQVFPDSS